MGIVYRLAAILLTLPLLGLASCQSPSTAPGDSLFMMRDDAQSRWASFENPKGERGAGGWENEGAKGHPYETFPPGDVKTLVDIEGHAGVVQRIWITVPDRDPATMRSLRIDMYWDGEEKPAVSAPFGDFFGAVHGDLTTFENALFASPEGRSFNCFIPMPFREGARITVTNEGERVRMFFYDVEYNLLDKLPDDALYFHAYWQRQNMTTMEQDFEFLPYVEGRGRFLGTHFGVYTHPDDIGWWGEGEFKVFLDGDTDLPTIVGTGTEDYVGTGWGQGEYINRTQGCWTADKELGRYALYRYHLDAPIYFHENARVTMQQMGGSPLNEVRDMMESGHNIKPVTIGSPVTYTLTKILEMDTPPDYNDTSMDRHWTNYWREDDVCAVSFFYLDKPSNNLPALQPREERIAELRIPGEE